MAARGARAAARADAAHRRAHEPRRGRSGRTGPPRGVPAGAAAIRLDRRPQRADRIRWGAGNAERIRRYAAELVALAPDVILATGTAAVAALQQATRTVPIVFVDRRRSGRRRLRREPGAAGRQRHRLYMFEYGIEREMAGAAQRDRARGDASGGPSRTAEPPGSASSP